MIDRERQPRDSGWTYVFASVIPSGDAVLSASQWRSGPVRVTSALEDAEYPDGIGGGPQWHISISAMGKRPKEHHVRRALRAFGMVSAEEDNHHPGVARHFWMPVDPAHRVECQCKTDEDVIVDPDGYEWTNPKPESGEECRGCEFEKMRGKPCPIHRAAEAP
jgi:hypothetical protein